MILAFWLTLSAAFAIDNNDHLILELAGGERLEGWFHRAESSAVVLTVPSTGEITTIPLSIVKSVTLNDQPQALSGFMQELGAAWERQRAWLNDPPPHPLPGIAAGAGLVVAGAGHGLLGEWGVATPMLAVDATCMGLIGLEAAGKGTGRIDVFFTAVMLSAVFKAYAASDGHRRAKRRRERLGLSPSNQ